MKKTFKQRLGGGIFKLLPWNRRTSNILRYEFNALVTNLIFYISPVIIFKRIKLNKIKSLNINIGSGGYGHDGWVNIDMGRHLKDLTFAYDIRKGIPFKSDTVSRIFAEHIIEHLEIREDIPKLFAEMLRVLKNNGRVRIIVPDGKKWLEAYVYNSNEKWKELGLEAFPVDMPTKMFMINHVFQQGGEHMFTYDFDSLKYLLEKVGFRSIEKKSFNVSDDSVLCLDREEHKDYSLYIEAVK